VRKNPLIASLAHQRIYDMIVSYGVETDEETEQVRYKFFEEELFGIEDSTKAIMEYFKGAATGSEAKRSLNSAPFAAPPELGYRLTGKGCCC